MRGICLLAIGKPAYMQFAVNMIATLKYHSPDIPINLISTKDLIHSVDGVYHKFDIFTEISEEDYLDKDGRFQPGKAKVNLYKYFWKNNNWKEIVYLDVDGICIRDIDKLFECDGYFKTQHDILHWADDKKVCEYFGLGESKLNGLNSSYQYVKKCPEAEQMYKHAAEAMEKPLDLKEQSNNWFNMQPDELYYAVGMAKMGIDEPYNEFCKYPVYFKVRGDNNEMLTPNEIIDRHYIIGCFGGERFNHKSIAKIYDKLTMIAHKKVFGVNNIFKYHYLMGTKHGELRKYKRG